MSLRDVANAAGVSIATVSHVLQDTKRMSPEVSERVRKAAKLLGYHPNRQARALRTGRTQTLGMLVPDLSNPFFPALLQAVETAARAAGYAVLVHDTENEPEVERQAMALLASFRVDGLVWVPVSARPIAPLLDRNAISTTTPPLPTVTLDRPVAGCDAVHADHEAGGALIAAHLRELGLRQVVLLSGPTDLPSASARRRGFLLRFAPHEPVFEAEVGFTHRLPPAVVARLAEGGFDAVVCANDAVAVGVVRALREGGACVPDDIGVVGFDDIPWSRLMDPPLTTVRQPVTDMGAAAVRLLTERFAEPGLPPRQAVLPVELVIRASTVPSSAQIGGTSVGAQPNERSGVSADRRGP